MSELKEPAWLTSLVDQRMALLEDKAAELLHLGQTTIFTFLTEPEQDNQLALRHWEDSCDNCKAFRPGALHSGTIVRYTRNGVRVIMSFGVCAQCATTFR